MAHYNLTRYVENLLKSTKNSPPSFTVHLKNDHWCLNNFNAGAKFAYSHQVASLLDDIRAQRIPVDLLELFDSENVPFYEGCLLVELRDYRPRDNIDDFFLSRVVLQPNSETLWADICQLNQKMGNKWSDQEALEMEARILMATAPPLCLDPDPHLVRAVNSTLRVSVPTAPVSLKRKASAMDPKETAYEKVRRAKIMQFMRPTINRPHTFKVLEAIQRKKLGITAPVPAPASAPAPPPSQFPQSQLPPPPPPAGTPALPSTSPSYDEQKTFKNGISSVSPVDGRVPTPVSQGRTSVQPYPQPTPPPPSQTPIKPVTITRQPSVDPHRQTSSPAGQLQNNQTNSVQPAPSQQQMQPPHPQYPVPAFTPTNPSPNFTVPQPALGKKKGGPQTQQPTASAQAQMQMYAFQQQQLQYHQAAAQRYQQAGQQPQASTANGSSGTRSPMIQNNQTQNPSRPSPLVANQPQPTRSPMPSGNPQGTPQSMHSQQQQTVQQQHAHALNLAIHQQNQYNYARAQALSAGQPPPPVPPLLAAHLAQVAQAQAQANNLLGQPIPTTGQPSQEQTQQHPVQMMAGYPMYNMNYAQMQLQPGRVPPGYPWPAAAMSYRRATNGQPQPVAVATNGNGHAPQMAVGRVMPGGVQGR